MAKKPKKRKSKKQDYEFYDFELESWEAYHEFGKTSRNHFDDPADYSENSTIAIKGRVIAPESINASRVNIRFYQRIKLEEHWKEPTPDDPPSSVGLIQTLRDKVTLDLNCWVPPRFLNNLQVSIASGKIKYANVWGEKLRWGRGLIYRISLSTSREEE